MSKKNDTKLSAKLSIKELITSSEWVQCICYYKLHEFTAAIREENSFRLKIVSFEKLSQKEIDDLKIHHQAEEKTLLQSVMKSLIVDGKIDPEIYNHALQNSNNLIQRQISPETRTVLEEGSLWLMKIEIINTSETKFQGQNPNIKPEIILIDQDEYVFERITQDQYYHIVNLSEFANASGLRNIYGGRKWLLPNKKVEGAYIFQLPDEEAEYFLSARVGRIEVL